MSAYGDSTRDWLLKKLLKAKESLVEQAREIRELGSQLSKANLLAQDLEKQKFSLLRKVEELSSKVDDLEFDIRQLKRVPPIAPNLTVAHKDKRGLIHELQVTSVEHANGQTLIRVTGV